MLTQIHPVMRARKVFGAALLALSAATVACGSSETEPDPANQGTFTLGAANASVVAGSNGTSTVTITRSGGFTGSVALTATGLPSGVTAAFDPPSASGTSSTLTFTAASTAAAGSSTVTVHGSATGLAEQTATLTLTIQPATTPISIDFCANALTWAAYQNEGAPWVRLIPDGNNTVTFTATSKVAFAYVEPNGPLFITRVKYLTAAELSKANGLACQDLTFANRTVTVNGMASSVEHASVTGERNAAIIIGTTATGQASWPAGTADVVALHETGTSGSASSSVWNADKVAVRRAVDLTSSQTFNVTAAEFQAPTSLQYGITGVNANDVTSAALMFFTEALTSSSLSTQARLWTPSAAPPASGTIPAVPAAMLAGNDLHEFTFNSRTTIDASNSVTRSVISTFKNPSNQTLTLGAAMNTPSFTKLTTTGPVRYRVQLASQSDYGSLLTLGVSNSGGNAITVDYSAAYAGSTPTTWDVSVPDLTGVAAWATAWNVEFGRTSSLNVTVSSAYAVTFKRTQWEPGTAKTALWRQIGVTP